MAMKYIKLFESWKLMEAEGKQDAFDVNNPGGWPVMNTTIADFRDAVKSEKGDEFLTSVLRRALQTGKEWNPEAGKDVLEIATYFTAAPRTGFTPFTRVKEAMKSLKLDYEDGDEMEKLYDILRKHIAEQEFCDYKETFTATKFSDIVKDFSNYVKKLEKMENSQRQKFTGTAGKVKSATDKNTLPIIKQILKDLEAKLQKTKDAKPKPYIQIAGAGETFLLELGVPEINDSELNSDEAKISEFVCKDIETLKIGEESYDIPVKDNQLTLGMVMAWLNNFAKTGKSKDALLSSTGFNNYKKDIASIFSGEEAENLTSFASTLKIGGQNIKFANSKDGGTETPMFGNGKMLGKCTFAFNSFKVTEEGKKSITDAELMDALIKAKKSIEIVGHTDSTGKEDYNQTLSEKRANAVLEVLKGSKDFAKIKATITAVGKGETQPAKDDEGGKNKDMATLNRRIEFIIDGKLAFDYSKI